MESGWKHKTALFLAGQAVSLFGTSLVQYAIIWYVTLKTQSGMMIAVASVCSFAPQIAVSLFAGVWADRLDRKRIVVAADTMTAAATLLLAVMFLMERGELWMIFTVAAVRSLGTGIQSPAVTALVPQLVPPEKLMRVNGIAGTVQSIILLVSPAASGALYALSHMEYIFFIDVATAAIGIGLLLAVRIPPHERAARNTAGYFDDWKEGFAFIRHTGFVRSLLVFFALFMFLIVPAAYLTPLMATRAFGPEVWRLTAIEILFSAGSVLGGIVVAVWGGFKSRGLTLAVTCVLGGMLTVALGFAQSFWFFLVMMFLMGLLIPFFGVAATVALQERVDAGMQGRVFGYVSIASAAAMPLGTFVFGPMADALRIETLLIGTGVMIAALGVWVRVDRNLRLL